MPVRFGENEVCTNMDTRQFVARLDRSIALVNARRLGAQAVWNVVHKTTTVDESGPEADVLRALVAESTTRKNLMRCIGCIKRKIGARKDLLALNSPPVEIKDYLFEATCDPDFIASLAEATRAAVRALVHTGFLDRHPELSDAVLELQK